MVSAQQNSYVECDTGTAIPAVCLWRRTFR